VLFHRFSGGFCKELGAWRTGEEMQVLGRAWQVCRRHVLVMAGHMCISMCESGINIDVVIPRSDGPSAHSLLRPCKKSQCIEPPPPQADHPRCHTATSTQCPSDSPTTLLAPSPTGSAIPSPQNQTRSYTTRPPSTSDTPDNPAPVSPTSTRPRGLRTSQRTWHVSM
jgi:hypothetical protein